MSPQTFRLVMQTGPTPGKVFDISKSELTIGRDANNEIVINDAEVSRKHSRISLQGDVYVLEDLGSTNGTFVDGQRLMGPHALRPGDLVLLGENVSMRFEAAAFDPDATIISTPGPVTMPAQGPTPLPIDEPLPPFEPVYQAPVMPPYERQMPPGAIDVEAPPSVPVIKRPKTGLIVGIGCLVLLCCGCIGLGFVVDQFSLYCTSPFNLIFGTLGFCP